MVPPPIPATIITGTTAMVLMQDSLAAFMAQFIVSQAQAKHN